MSATALAALPPAPATTGNDGRAVMLAAGEAMEWGDFAEVERLWKAVRTRAQRTTKGEPESTVLRLGLSQGMDSGPGLAVRQAEQAVALTAAWASQNPQSPIAHYVHVSALISLAWEHRGSGYANTVPPQARALFRATLERAASHAAAHADVLLSDGLGYRALLHLGRGLGWDDGRTRSIYEQGLTRFPEEDTLHFEALSRLLPKWGGDARQVDRHIQAVVRRTQATRGLAMYALLYTEAAEQQFVHKLFEDSMARWERLDQGFADLTSQYPHPQHYNSWAWMACQAQDRKRLLELLPKLGAEPELEHWGSNPRQTYDTCKAWAEKI